MRRDEALAIIRAHEAELRALGVERIELFGSVARDEAGPGSDVDVLVDVTNEVRARPWGGYSQLDDVRRFLSRALTERVDAVRLPLSRKTFLDAIKDERVTAF